MAEIPATEFRAKCLELMDRVAQRRESFLKTKRGRPVAGRPSRRLHERAFGVTAATAVPSFVQLDGDNSGELVELPHAWWNGDRSPGDHRERIGLGFRLSQRISHHQCG